MSRLAKSTRTKTTHHKVVPFVLTQEPTVWNLPVPNPPAKTAAEENPPAATTDSTAESPALPNPPKTSLVSFEGVAVLALGESGEILAARDACIPVFGWEAPALVGQNVRVLLRGGLDNEVGRFLHRHRAGKNPPGIISLRVLAVRKDGTEFPAQITTLTWNWDTAVTTKGDVSRLCWTAAFQDLTLAAKPGQQTTKEASPADEVAAVTVKQEPDLHEAVAAPQVVPASPALPQTEEKATQAIEQVTMFDLKQRIRDLEEQLNKATSELVGAKAGAEKLGCHESELQVQLAAAKEAAGYTEAALKEETARREKLEERLQTLSNSLSLEQAERSKRFEEELVSLRQERDELNSKLEGEQKGASESERRALELEARLGRNATELERAKAELQKLTAEREQSESSWRQQLDTVWVAKKEVEGAWAGAVERNKHVEKELANLREEHDELASKLAAEQKAVTDSQQRAKEVANRLNRNAADSDRARAELEKENEKRERAEAEWRKQLEAARTLKTKLETSLAEAMERNTHLEGEIATARRERDELQSQLKAKQRTGGPSVQRADELQRHVEQQAAELERLAAELEKQRAERERAETRTREQQEAAKALAKKREADWESAVERNVQFEEELVELRRSRDELMIQLKAEQQTSAEAAHRAGELERRLERSTTELERLTADAEREHSEHESVDSDWREQLEAAQALARKLDAAWTAATERSRRFEEDTTGLRQEREELRGRLAIAQREAADAQDRVNDLENQVNRMAAELKRAARELEKWRVANGNSDSEAHIPVNAGTAMRGELNHHNGHCTPNPDGAKTPRPGLASMAAGLHKQKVSGPERTQVDEAASRHTGHVIQQYNFDHPAGKTARRETSSSKKRLHP
jgi:chromosome segregation ATPase